jgi:hypothetical protein
MPLHRFTALMAIVILALLTGRANASPESDFWRWFQKNENALFDFERDQERTFDRLAAEMQKVDPSLTFEFGPKDDGRREFVISADGIVEAFPKVESLYAAAPKAGPMEACEVPASTRAVRHRVRRHLCEGQNGLRAPSG